jgi:hypothetical protein
MGTIRDGVIDVARRIIRRPVSTIRRARKFSARMHSAVPNVPASPRLPLVFQGVARVASTSQIRDLVSTAPEAVRAVSAQGHDRGRQRADIVLWDPDKTVTLTNARCITVATTRPRGMQVTGYPVATYVRHAGVRRHVRRRHAVSATPRGTVHQPNGISDTIQSGRPRRGLTAQKPHAYDPRRFIATGAA